MKKILSLIILCLTTFSLLAADISGNFTLNDTILYMNNDFSNIAKYNLNLKLNGSTNNVKFYSEANISTAQVFDLNKAYIKYRLPYQDRYIPFSIGKAPFSLGGGLILNAGNILFESQNSEIPTTWLVQGSIPFYENEDFQTLNLGLFATLPIDGETNRIGGRLTYEINNDYFENIEVNVLYSSLKTLISTGLKGSLYFDYGLYGRFDTSDIKKTEVSMFLIKVYNKLSINFEGLYKIEENKFVSTATISYQLSDKIKTSLNYNNLKTPQGYNNNIIFTNQFTLVQGLSFATGITYIFEQKITSLTFNMEFKF